MVVRVWLVLGLVALTPRWAWSQGVDRAIQRGIVQFGLAQFDASRRTLLRAKGRTTAPKPLGQIHLYLGLNAAAQGNRAIARREMERALRLDATIRLNPEDFKREFITLLDEVRQRLKGRLVVSAAPDALVIVDGRPRAAGVRRLDLPVGRHEIKVQDGRGVVLHTGTVVVRADRTETVNVAPVADDVGRPPPTVPDQMLTRARSRPPRRRLWTWVAAGGSVAALAVGIGVGAWANSQFDDYVADGCYTENPDCEPRERKIRNKDLAANVMYGLAGGLAVTAVVLYFLEGKTGEGRAALVTPMVAGRVGLAVTGRY